MTENPSKFDVLDFIISVLMRHEKELDKDLIRLERVMKKIKRNSKHQESAEVLAPGMKPIPSGTTSARERRSF